MALAQVNGGEEIGSFDVAWPTDEESAPHFAEGVIRRLLGRGFCVVQAFLDEDVRRQGAEEAGERAGWKRFIEELEPAYLGRGACGKAAWLEPDDPVREASGGLGLCNRLLTETWLALEPLTQATLSFSTAARSDGLLRAPCAGRWEEEELLKERGRLDEAAIQRGTIEDHLKFVQQRRIGMFYFLRGSQGTLALHPKDGEDVVIPIVEGQLVLFRHDRHSYTYTPAGESYLALQAWILSEGQGTLIQEYDGPARQFDEALGLVTGPPAPTSGHTGTNVSLMSMDCLLAMNALGDGFYGGALIAGTDSARHLSSIRWDPDLYFEPVKEYAFGKYYSNHGGFIEEEAALGFDNIFFGLDEETVSLMDPCQRNSMEVGYHILHKAGWTRSTLMGAHIGVYFGNCGTDWGGLKLNPAVHPITPDYFNGWSAHMTNARLSYTFGMRGPLSTSDTACSSSLVATGTAHNAVRRVEPDQLRISSDAHTKWALVIGTNGLWAPFSWVGLCGPRMLSAKGRCFTFDHSADGFARGEGTSGISIAVTGQEPSGRLAMFCGSAINQDGRSASMTAPHGPSQQECLRASMREASISPADVRVAELHGTGTALGDPIEVGALRQVMKARTDPILKTSSKCNLEHGEANAGMAGLLKCCILLHQGTCPPNIHLVDLNPHIDSSAYPVQFPDNATDLGVCSGYAGVSSFGFGGTNARADIWAKASVGVRKTGTLDEEKVDYITVRCSRCLGWMDHVGGNMIPTVPDKPPNGRYKAHCIREEPATYDHCSLCYTGGYVFGAPFTETALPKGKLYITGSWDGWTGHHPMEQVMDGLYLFHVTMGETRVEHFYFTMEKNTNFALYPVCKHAGPEIRVEGPKKHKEGCAWLMEGRDAGWAEGTLMRIALLVDARTGSRRVTWEPAPDDARADAGPSSTFERSYHVLGSWTSGRMAKMTKVPGRCAFEYETRIGVTGQESFQLARDADLEQLIYPAFPWAQRSDVPVRGPDSFGKDKRWLVVGNQNELLRIRLEVADGHISVSASCASSGSRRWESVDGRARKCFYVAGSWTETYLPMERDENQLDVYRLRMVMPSQLEHFQILVDEDPNCAYHPEVPGFPCGGVFVQGPDAEGSESPFQLEGEVGTVFDIVLDLKAVDKRLTVAWHLVTEPW